jgi:homocitrate synthase NifV
MGGFSMVKIVDNTLTSMVNCQPRKEELQAFCKMLIEIGVDYIEMSTHIYNIIENLTEGIKYILHLDNPKDIPKYPGFYKYICRHGLEYEPNVIGEFQVNDIREIVQLRTYSQLESVKIVGLDDLMCYNYTQTMDEIKSIFRNVNFCPQNTYNCATALAVQWLMNGGCQVTTSFSGFGNFAATEEVIVALRLAIRHKPNRDLSILPKMNELFETMTGTVTNRKKPVIGKDIFKVEAGVHVDGILKNPSIYEPYDPKIVGGKTQIVLGKHSGCSAIKNKMLERNIPVQSDQMLEYILKAVQEQAINKKNSLSDDEFEMIARGVVACEN